MGITTAAIGTAAYLVAVLGAIAFFMREISHALSDEGHVTSGEKAGAAIATVLLLFFIIGGFVWFRVLVVGL